MTPVFIFPLVLKVVSLQSKVTGLAFKSSDPRPGRDLLGTLGLSQCGDGNGPKHRLKCIPESVDYIYATFCTKVALVFYGL